MVAALGRLCALTHTVAALGRSCATCGYYRPIVHGAVLPNTKVVGSNPVSHNKTFDSESFLEGFKTPRPVHDYPSSLLEIYGYSALNTLIVWRWYTLMNECRPTREGHNYDTFKSIRQKCQSKKMIITLILKWHLLLMLTWSTGLYSSHSPTSCPQGPRVPWTPL